MQVLLKDKSLFNQLMQSLSSQFEERVPEKTKILGFIEGKGMRRVSIECKNVLGLKMICFII